MRFQRLLLEIGASSVRLDFHPRLTVVSGLGPREREGLAIELLGGLGGPRPGSHLEVVDDTGRRLAVLHPKTNDDRVIELGSAQDVTDEFRREDGTVDLFAPMGLDLPTVQKFSNFAASDMASRAKVDGVIARLAARDQHRLWQTAYEVRATKASLETQVVAAGADPIDAPIIEEIESRHAIFEAAQARLERVRHFGIFVGSAFVAGAVPAVALHSLAAIPMLLVAIATTLLSIVFRRRMEKAGKAERKALDAAGVDSYLTFRLQRVNGIVDGQGDRTKLARCVTDHREAVARWRSMADDATVEWAFEMREKVQTAAAQLRKGQAIAGTAANETTEPAELAQALIVRLTQLRHVGKRSEALPLLLDEPLSGVSPSTKQWLLELLGRSAGTPQVIYLTDDPDVVAWARMESMGGDLAIIEAAPQQGASAAVFS